MHKCSWTSMRGLIASAQRFPRFLWHVRMPFVAMALPWCHTADMLTCKVVAVAIYTPATQSALSVYLTLLVFSFSLICFLSFNFYKLSSTSTYCFFLRPSPLFPAPTRVAYTSGWCLWTWQSLSVYGEGRGVGRPLSVAVYNSAGVSQSHRHLAWIFPSRGAMQPKYSLQAYTTQAPWLALWFCSFSLWGIKGTVVYFHIYLLIIWPKYLKLNL